MEKSECIKRKLDGLKREKNIEKKKEFCDISRFGVFNTFLKVNINNKSWRFSSVYIYIREHFIQRKFYQFKKL